MRIKFAYFFFKAVLIIYKNCYGVAVFFCSKNIQFIFNINFITIKALEGWLRSYEPIIHRGMSSSLNDLTLVDFISLFHSNRKIRLLFDKLRRKLDLNVTAICNYNCQYCYQRSRDENWEEHAKKAISKELSIEDFKEIIREAAELGARYLKITGGEPLTKNGLIDLISYAFKLNVFKEVEILTNGALMFKYSKDLKEAINGNENKFHIHTSIDGLVPDTSNSISKYSQKHYDNLKKLFKDFRKVKISVNSMWTTSLTQENSLIKLYKLMQDYSIVRWTISFPYLVNTLRKIIKIEPSYIPDFEEVIYLSEKLVKKHIELGSPFQLSIPLVYKHEMFDPGYSVSLGCYEDHPCYPCHGSYLIVGPGGEIIECLLVPQTTSANVGNGGLLQAMLKSVKNNNFYDIRYKQVARKCKGCRYEMLCQGQCVNDRANSQNFNFNNHCIYGRDKRACSLLNYSETELWPVLKPNKRETLSKHLNKNGFYPAVYKSLADIVNQTDPIKSDQI